MTAFDTATAAGRLRILWDATADPQFVMGDVEVADVETVLQEHAAMATELARIPDAINLAFQYGGIDGDHHKAWVIDQMIRILSGDDYERLVAEANDGDYGPNTYSWDEGIAP